MNTPTLKELCARATPGPYFVDHHKGTMDDFVAHSKSGLATVDTGRSGDWPIAYFCEWPQAQLIARIASPEVALAVYEALTSAAGHAEFRELTVRNPENAKAHGARAKEYRRLLSVLDGKTTP